MLRSFAGLVGVVFTATAIAAPVPKPKPPYHPTNVGDTWVVRSGDASIVYAVTSIEKKGGTLVVKDEVIEVRRASGINTKHPKDFVRKVSVSDEGVTVLESRNKPIDPPVCLLKLPHRPGETWENHKGLIRTIGQARMINTKLGPLMAIPVDYVFDPTGATEDVTEWYAPGFGLVLSMAYERATEIVRVRSEMTEFTPGKPDPAARPIP